MLVLNCAERSAPYNLSANVVLKNPNGEHLVCGTLPFPTMYTTLVALWVIVALWMLEKILRKPKRTTLVTLAFLLMIVLKITYCVLSMEWWKDISRTGLSPSISLRLLRVLFNAAFEFVFFGTWMVLSSGWAVLRKSFNRTSAITLSTTTPTHPHTHILSHTHISCSLFFLS